MSETRVACARPGCPNTILPTTAARTGGICRPCEQGRIREEHVAYVRANLREIDPWTGVTDPVEIVRLLAKPLRLEELIVVKPFPGEIDQFIGSLSPHDLHRVIELTLSYLASPEEEEAAEDLARWLAAFTDAQLHVLQRAWLDTGRLWPTILFRRAPPDIRDQLIELAETEPMSRNHALIALAWIGDDAVIERFGRWRARPPKWSSDLYVPPHEYAHEAGWELDERGRRRDLVLPVAYALVEGDGAPVVDLTKPDRGRCSYCDAPLTTLFSLDANDPRLAPLGLPERVATCVNCTFDGMLFMKLDREGNATVHPRNEPRERPEEGCDDYPWPDATPLILGERRGLLHAADQSLLTTFSQIGGLGGWISDAEYPPCPDCGRTMDFIGQVAGDDVGGLFEGLFYALWCRTCRVTATTYQQT